jgi:hypothetical protein
MNKSEFKIGSVFYTGAGAWICVDVGDKYIYAVRADELASLLKIHGTVSNLTVGSHVLIFDSDDWEGCSLDPDEFA